MNLNRQYLTKNKCFISNRKLIPSGIVLHSTGVNNPNIGRYVGPDDGLIGPVSSSNWNQLKPDGREVCAHAFIGKIKNGIIATYQTLPWEMRGWHAGGYANDTHIGIEICEGNLNDADYFAKTYKEASELCAMLCKEYGIKPKIPGLICHSEGFKLGMCSNHADVMHWFPKHGKSMNTFRTDVETIMEEDDEIITPMDLILNGKIVTVKRIAKTDKNGGITNYVELRKVAEMLGGTVEFNEKNNPQVSITIK